MMRRRNQYDQLRVQKEKEFLADKVRLRRLCAEKGDLKMSFRVLNCQTQQELAELVSKEGLIK